MKGRSAKPFARAPEKTMICLAISSKGMRRSEKPRHRAFALKVAAGKSSRKEKYRQVPETEVCGGHLSDAMAM